MKKFLSYLIIILFISQAYANTVNVREKPGTAFPRDYQLWFYVAAEKIVLIGGLASNVAVSTYKTTKEGDYRVEVMKTKDGKATFYCSNTSFNFKNRVTITFEDATFSPGKCPLVTPPPPIPKVDLPKPVPLVPLGPPLAR